MAGYDALWFISLPIPVYQDFITGLWDGRALAALYFVHKGVNDFFALILAVTTSSSYAMITERNCGYAGVRGSINWNGIYTWGKRLRQLLYVWTQIREKFCTKYPDGSIK